MAFLPRLYTEGFEPIIGYYGGVYNGDEIYIYPRPMYHDLVDEFVDFVNAQDCWRVADYLATVGNAALQEVQAMMTFFLQGEKFCDGFWDGMIKDGHVHRLLERLSEIEQELKYPESQL